MAQLRGHGGASGAEAARQLDPGWSTKLDLPIAKVTLRRVSLPLRRPYSPAYATFNEFEPILVEIHLEDGSVGWGEGQIAEGSSKETRKGGWFAALGWARAIVGRSAQTAIGAVLHERHGSSVAATALVSGIEMAARHPLLGAGKPLRTPLLVPVSGTEPDAVGADIEGSIGAGFRTLKVKIGKDPEASLNRIRMIQGFVRGRASLRLDANRTFTRDQAVAFAHGLDPNGIELFEQPCHADAWDDNAAVAAECPVPVMLDESLSTMGDIERAGAIPGVGFCKLKLKRFGSVEKLRQALQLVNDLGMRAVLGDGMSTNLGCWMEARIGDGLIFGAGEFNGFLKPKLSLMEPELVCDKGHLLVPPGYWPTFDPGRLSGQILEETVITQA